jgi:hypothetical protein
MVVAGAGFGPQDDDDDFQSVSTPPQKAEQGYKRK